MARDEVDDIKEIKPPPTVVVSSTIHTNGNLSTTNEKSDASSSGTLSRSNRSPASLGMNLLITFLYFWLIYKLFGIFK